jgi:aminoglycoside phosphotransferase (APT) family kinase protein
VPGLAGDAVTELEVELPGGTTAVVRVGATVRKPVRPWSPAVRVLLRHLRAAGVTGVPRWHGVDEKDRDVFDYLPGEAGNDPLSAQVRGDTALVTAARLLRTVHDASVPLLDDRDLPWQLPPVEPVEVVCHGDFATYNCVFDGGEAVGLIDFDHARPGPRRWDLAHALYRFAPLADPANRLGFGDPTEQARRARLFLDSYGCTREQRRAAMDGVGSRLMEMVAFMRDAAAAGDPFFARHIEDGHADIYENDIRYVETHAELWRARVVEDGAG